MGTYPAISGGDDESTEESECEDNAFSVVAGTDESEIYDSGKDVLRKPAAILGTSLSEPASRLVESPRETGETGKYLLGPWIYLTVQYCHHFVLRAIVT